jgi:hypothetical protein
LSWPSVEASAARPTPAEIGEADQADEIAQNPEIRVGHQLPHQRGQRRRRHQRQQQQDRRHVVEPRRLHQQERDAEAEHQLDDHGQESIGQRDLDCVPERAVGEEVEVVVEPDETLHRRQVQPEPHQRVIDRRHERNEDADAHQQGRQAQQVRQSMPGESALLHRNGASF